MSHIENYAEDYTKSPGGSEQRSKPDDVFNAELAAEMIKRTNKLNDTTIDMALRLKQAREFMAWSASHLRGLWLDWQDESTRACRQMNEFRMTFDRETKMVAAAGKDIAEFFNSPEYLKAHATLQETLSMLQSFSAMKKDGTLDAFADFILKVKCT